MLTEISRVFTSAGASTGTSVSPEVSSVLLDGLSVAGTFCSCCSCFSVFVSLSGFSVQGSDETVSSSLPSNSFTGTASITLSAVSCLSPSETLLPLTAPVTAFSATPVRVNDNTAAVSPMPRTFTIPLFLLPLISPSFRQVFSQLDFSCYSL